jgi:hypothetical protein
MRARAQFVAMPVYAIAQGDSMLTTRSGGRFRPLIVPVLVLVALLSLAAGRGRAQPLPDELGAYEDGSRAFLSLDVGDHLRVYWHQRMIGQAIVEKDRVIYQFDRRNGELRRKIEHWRQDLPSALPGGLLTEAEILARVGEKAARATLAYISPESDVFPLPEPPAGPCWVVYSEEQGQLGVTIHDARTGQLLGQGVPPPYEAFSITGPQYPAPCSGAWTSWSESAEYWFQNMGYTTDQVVWPERELIQSHVASNETALFYELCHGNSSYFSFNCGSPYEDLLSSEVGDWLFDYPRMPFAFLGSCDGMCQLGPGTFSYEFRKGSSEGTATVGYCNMSAPICETCWIYSLDWQNTLFESLSQGSPLRDAFDEANAAVPSCAASGCMVMAGDDGLTLVPTVSRADVYFQELTDLTNGDLGDAGDGRCAAWIDFDGDGDLDLHVVNYGQPDLLLRNEGGDLFVNVATDSLADAGNGTAAAWADYDNDGDLDVYLSRDLQPNKLLRNDGGGAFTDVPLSMADDDGPGRGVAWGDYDRDGLIDIFLANDGTFDALFQNFGPLGDDWLFLRMGGIGVEDGSSCPTWCDYNGDGLPDLYLTRRLQENILYMNSGTMGFFSVLGGTVVADPGDGRGVTWGDQDGDGIMDLYLVNAGGVDRLLRGDGTSFQAVTGAELGDTGDGRCVGWADQDNDGDLDLFVGRGLHRDFILLNEDGAFARVVMENAGESQSLTWGDYDGDGDLDLYLVRNGANRLYRNDQQHGNHWLEVDLMGTTSNRAAIGARLRLVAGGRVQVRRIAAGGNPGQDALTAHFGLGGAASVDSLVVAWPSGLVQEVPVGGVDRRLQVTEGDDLSPVAGSGSWPRRPILHQNVPNPFNPRTVIAYELDLSSRVTVRIYDAAGRRVRLLQDGVMQSGGRHEISWDGRDDGGRDLASGTYVYEVMTPAWRQTAKMALLR